MGYRPFTKGSPIPAPEWQVRLQAAGRLGQGQVPAVKWNTTGCIRTDNEPHSTRLVNNRGLAQLFGGESRHRRQRA